MLFFLSATVVPQSQAELPKEKTSTITMDVTEAYLEDVLKLFSKQSGINFVASEEVRDKTVTTYLDNVPVQAALETILKANKLVLKPVEGVNLYLVTELAGPKVVTTTKVYQLKYARVTPTAGEIATAFGLGGSLITTTFTSSTGGTSAASSAISAGTTAPQGVGFVNVIRSLLTEHGSVVTDPRTNSIIVTDIPERFPIIDETIARLDVKPVQLFIEAEILEVTLDTLRRIGVDWGDSSTGQIASYLGPKRSSHFPFPPGMFDKGTFTRTHTQGTFSLSDANILFKLLATEKDVKFLARPRLLTLSNEVAEIRIVADAVTGTKRTSVSDTGEVIQEAERNTVGTVLRVTPQVNENQYITMVIEPEVSRVITSAFNTSFQDPNRRAARTTVMVEDGGTAMIAGLISSEGSETARRIPGLGDIPILGLPFKRTETEKKSTEVILFITPHIIKEEKITTVLEREQTPLKGQRDSSLAMHHRRLLRERAIVETLGDLLR